MSAFIVDDGEYDNFEDLEEDESNDEDELFDSVCAFCDNGGNLLWYVFSWLLSWIRLVILLATILFFSPGMLLLYGTFWHFF